MDILSGILDILEVGFIVIENEQIVNCNERFRSFFNFEKPLKKKSIKALPQDLFNNVSVFVKERDFEKSLEIDNGEFKVKLKAFEYESKLVVTVLSYEKISNFFYDELSGNIKEDHNRLREERYQSIISVLNTGVWEYYADIDYQWCSKEYFTMLGYKESSFNYFGEGNLRRVWVDLIHPDDRDEAVKRFYDYINNNNDPDAMYENRFRLRREDGSYAWIRSRGKTIFAKGHKTKLTVGTHIDFTEIYESQVRFYKLFNEVPALAVQIYDKDGKVVYWNKASENLYGYSEKEALGKSVFELIVKEQDYNRISRELVEFFEKKSGSLVSEYNFKNKDGREILVLTNNVVLPIGDDAELISIDIDLSKRKEIEDLLYLEKEHLRATLLSVADGVISTDKEDKITLMNKVAEDLTGYTLEEAYGKDVSNVLYIKSLAEINNESIEDSYNDKGDLDNTILIKKNGAEILIEQSIAPIYNRYGGELGSVIVFRDSTEKKARIREIEYLSQHDSLTGLFNRHFFERVAQELDEEENYPIALFMIDINGLKLTNDAFGHAKGDQLLKKVADIIKDSCRGNDIIGRVGGDEFSIFLPKTNYDQAKRVQKRILEEADKAMLETIAVSIAIGFAIKSESQTTMDEIKTHAENEMYKNKLVHGKKMKSRTINAIMETLNERYVGEKDHSSRVIDYACKLGEVLNLDRGILEDLKTAAKVHDIGKIVIPETILNKENPLSESEYEAIKKHSETGYHILRSVDEYMQIADIVLYHHERWDGYGYPENLKECEIPLIARIISIVDAFEAMTSHRPYRKKLSMEIAINELRNNAGTQFDPVLVDLFIREVLEDTS